MNERQQKTALITGASRGLGLELSRCFARDGIGLILVARDGDRLAAAAKQLQVQSDVKTVILPVDLAMPDGVASLFNELTRHGINIDYLVNNAGVGEYGSFADSDDQANRRMLELNITALSELSRRLLPAMLENNFGRILNVASLTAYQPGGPKAAMYYASKSFVLSLSKGLSRELHGSNVTVTALCPGPMYTGFQAGNGFGETRLYRLFNNDAAKTARAGYRAMMRGSRVSIPGLFNKLLAFGGELPPRRIALEINRWLLVRNNTIHTGGM